MSDLKTGQLAFFRTGITDVRRNEQPSHLPESGFTPPAQRQPLPSAQIFSDADASEQALYQASMVSVNDPELLSPHKFSATLHSAIASAKELLKKCTDTSSDERLVQGIALLEEEQTLRDLAQAYRNALLAG